MNPSDIMRYGAATYDKISKLKTWKYIPNLLGGSRTPKHSKQYLEQIEHKYDRWIILIVG